MSKSWINSGVLRAGSSSLEELFTQLKWEPHCPSQPGISGLSDLGKTTIGALIIWVRPKNSLEQFWNAQSRMNPNGVASSHQGYGTLLIFGLQPFLSVQARSRTELPTLPHHCKKTRIKCHMHLLPICLRFFSQPSAIFGISFGYP